MTAATDAARTDFERLARDYVAAWNQTDPAARRAAVAELFSADVRYIDPLVDVAGTEALAATIGAVHEQFPGLAFRLAGPVDGHHDQARFGWELGPADGDAPIAGFDVVVTDGAGRIERVHGFLDRVPAA